MLGVVKIVEDDNENGQDGNKSNDDDTDQVLNEDGFGR